VVTADVGEKPILFFAAGSTNEIAPRLKAAGSRVEAYDIQGHALGSYPDVQAALRGLPAGLSILRDGTGKTWREFLPVR
jgi:succinyl-CoA synthetase alpha subunit